MIIQTNIPTAPRFAYAVNAEAAATPLSKALSFLGGVFGFNLGVRVREAFTRPSGMGIREYCASTMAFVEVTVAEPVALGAGVVSPAYNVKVVESIRVPGSPKSRDLMVIGEAIPESELEAITARAEAVAIGFNSAYHEISALTNADLTTVNNMIEQAIGAQLASMRAAAAQQAMSAPVSATN